MKIQRQALTNIHFQAAMALLIAVCAVIGCSSAPVASQPAAADCVGEMSRRIREAPIKEYLHTLDGQAVRLQDFFHQCQEKAPDCILYTKFYHWKNEVKKVVSRSDRGLVEHRIRAYYNPLSICQPQKIHPGRTHGDVAEFYDAGGRFMGLAVYMGQGQYFLLYDSGYQNSK